MNILLPESQRNTEHPIIDNPSKVQPSESIDNIEIPTPPPSTASPSIPNEMPIREM
jgi:hypothetical protein